MENLCLMAHEDDSSEVNSELDSITIEQWEVLYENIYTKYKKLKHENKSLKIEFANHEHVETQSNRDEGILTEYETLKSENACLATKVAMLELDVESLSDKLSSSMHEVEDLKYTLARFVKRQKYPKLYAWYENKLPKRRHQIHPTRKVHSSENQDCSPIIQI